MARISLRTAIKQIFKPRQAKHQSGTNDAITMTYEPQWSKLGNNVLYNNIVYSATQMKSRFFAKLEPRHIRNENGKITTITDSNIARVLNRPNDYQTTYEFLAQAYFMRKKDKTCYIYANGYENKGGGFTYTDLIVLLPNTKPIIKEYQNGELYFIFKFDNYDHFIELPYNQVIVWRDNLEDQQYRGGGVYSEYAAKDLHSTLEAYHTIKETIVEAAKLGCMFDGYLKINAYAADQDKAKKMRDEFVEDISNAKGKIPTLDNGADYVALSRQLKMVDAATLKELKENALIYEGVTLEMLTGKMSTQDKEAFYENHIEPAAISLGQAMSKVFFSQWQTSHGDQIILYPHKVQLMATSEIVSIISSTISAGVFTINEYRNMLGYAPLESGGEARPRGFNSLDGQNDIEGVTE